MSTNSPEIKTIDPPGCAIQDGMVLSESCPTCGHQVYAHIWPTGVCTLCWEKDKYEALEQRVKELETEVERLLGASEM